MTERKKELVLSVTRNDCKWDYFRGSGAGGQHRNKTSTGVRCTHPASGAVGKATELKSQVQNKRLAFKRMAESEKFQLWVRMQCGMEEKVEAEVRRAMAPRNIKTEVQVDGIWKVKVT